ncbi:hypothetical protein [Rhodococcus globerulus]|uniref:Uncharacterized protein n=1 Tax=Rhodococcus globerulus TaxID=33008 RepID=A0ABU4C5X2_RHOGO|nr:hypothetical protein [Rhodococcus globerulus]MDV6271661.1 hypothetical protein [Rhodococcus globerulus]
MTIAIPPSRHAESHPARSTVGTAELKRHIALMFGYPIPAETSDSVD